MGLSTARVAGVRHVLNSTNVDPEGESQGIRGDWIAELYGAVANYADLPTSGNWQGRRRWVTALGIEFMWSGSAWVPVGGRLPTAEVGLEAQTWTTANSTLLAFGSTVRQSHPNTVTGNVFRALIPGIYQVDVHQRLGVSGSRRFWLMSRHGSGTWTNRVVQAIENGKIEGSFQVSMQAGDELDLALGANLSGSSNVVTYSGSAFASFAFVSAL